MTTDVEVQQFGIKKPKQKSFRSYTEKRRKSVFEKRRGTPMDSNVHIWDRGEKGSARKKSLLLWSTGRRPFITRYRIKRHFSTAKLLPLLVGYKMMSGRNIL